jgi:hypothetical protein
MIPSKFNPDDHQRNSSQKHFEQVENIRLLPQSLHRMPNELPVLLCASFYAPLFWTQRALGRIRGCENERGGSSKATVETGEKRHGLDFLGL